MLEHYLEQLREINEVFYLQALKVTEEEEGDEDVVTLIGLTRLMRDVHREVAETIKEVREIADDGTEKERAAAKAQGKEG
jgi:hypothetical protein